MTKRDCTQKIKRYYGGLNTTQNTYNQNQLLNTDKSLYDSPSDLVNHAPVLFTHGRSRSKKFTVY